MCRALRAAFAVVHLLAIVSAAGACQNYVINITSTMAEDTTDYTIPCSLVGSLLVVVDSSVDGPGEMAIRGTEIVQDDVIIKSHTDKFWQLMLNDIETIGGKLIVDAHDCDSSSCKLDDVSLPDLELVTGGIFIGEMLQGDISGVFVGANTASVQVTGPLIVGGQRASGSVGKVEMSEVTELHGSRLSPAVQVSDNVHVGRLDVGRAGAAVAILGSVVVHTSIGPTSVELSGLTVVKGSITIEAYSTSMVEAVIKGVESAPHVFAISGSVVFVQQTNHPNKPTFTIANLAYVGGDIDIDVATNSQAVDIIIGSAVVSSSKSPSNCRNRGYRGGTDCKCFDGAHVEGSLCESMQVPKLCFQVPGADAASEERLGYFLPELQDSLDPDSLRYTHPSAETISKTVIDNYWIKWSMTGSRTDYLSTPLLHPEIKVPPSDGVWFFGTSSVFGVSKEDIASVVLREQSSCARQCNGCLTGQGPCSKAGLCGGFSINHICGIGTPCQDNRQSDCKGGLFSPPGSTECRLGRICPAGTFVKNVADNKDDTDCAGCPFRVAFSDEEHSPSCKSCSVCSDWQYLQTYCWPASDTVCHNCTEPCATCNTNSTGSVICNSCLPGHKLVDAGTAVADCVPCSEGSFNADPVSQSCASHRMCDAGAGEYMTVPPTSSSDRQCANGIGVILYMTESPASHCWDGRKQFAQSLNASLSNHVAVLNGDCAAQGFGDMKVYIVVGSRADAYTVKDLAAQGLVSALGKLARPCPPDYYAYEGTISGSPAVLCAQYSPPCATDEYEAVPPSVTVDRDCQPCPSTCKECELDSQNDLRCTKCKDSYVLMSSGLCVTPTTGVPATPSPPPSSTAAASSTTTADATTTTFNPTTTPTVVTSLADSPTAPTATSTSASATQTTSPPTSSTIASTTLPTPQGTSSTGSQGQTVSVTSIPPTSTSGAPEAGGSAGVPVAAVAGAIVGALVVVFVLFFVFVAVRRNSDDDKQSVNTTPLSVLTNPGFDPTGPRRLSNSIRGRPGEHLSGLALKNAPLAIPPLDGDPAMAYRVLDSGHVRYESPEGGFMDPGTVLPAGGSGGETVYEAPRTWQYPADKVQLKDKLGSGNFGLVFRGEAPGIVPGVDVGVVAVKMLKAGAHDTAKDDFLSETQLMVSLDPHPHVVTLLGICTKAEPYMMIMEYCANGNLREYVKGAKPTSRHPNSPLTSSTLLHMCRDVADGMAFLQSRNVVHRDLAARNILIDAELNAKISDLGMARDVNQHKDSIYARSGRNVNVPIRWLAPECLTAGTYSSASDVWAFGVLLWEVSTYGRLPYPEHSTQEVSKGVGKGHLKLSPPAGTSQQFFGVIAMCQATKAAKRPKFTQVVALMDGLLANDASKRHIPTTMDDLLAGPPQAATSNRAVYEDATRQETSIRPCYEARPATNAATYQAMVSIRSKMSGFYAAPVAEGMVAPVVYGTSADLRRHGQPSADAGRDRQYSASGPVNGYLDVGPDQPEELPGSASPSQPTKPDNSYEYVSKSMLNRIQSGSSASGHAPGANDYEYVSKKDLARFSSQDRQ